MKNTFTNVITGNEEQVTRENIINAIIDYFKEDENTFNNCIEQLDDYNGYLGDNRYYEMYMLEDFYGNGTDIFHLLNMAYFGRDEDSWHTDERGEKIYDSFNPNRDYFSWNGYGNLVSSDYKDYSCYLDSYAIEQMLENMDEISEIGNDSTLCELFEMLADVELSEITE